MKKEIKKILSVVISAALLFVCTSCAELEYLASDIAYVVSELAQETNANTVSPEGELEVYFIDVGQADSALALCGGESMLIDGGNADDSNLIAAFLKKHGIDCLDYIVCTHAHEDHCGGLSGALSVSDAKNIMAPEKEADTKVYNNFKKKAEERGVEIEHPKAGDSFAFGGCVADILGPVNEKKDTSTNNTSIVLKLTYGNTSFLFTGDAEREEEKDIIERGFDLSADVLKVGHHGSSTSTSYTFLREVMPEYAVISCGKGNSYGHPHEETLSRLKDADVKVYRTDMQGDIKAVSDGETVTVIPSKNADADTLNK